MTRLRHLAPGTTVSHEILMNDVSDSPLGIHPSRLAFSARTKLFAATPKLTSPNWAARRSIPRLVVFPATPCVFAINSGISLNEASPFSAKKKVPDEAFSMADSLATRGEQLKKLPKGWLYIVLTLDRDLVLKSAKRMAHIVQDEFQNSYQQ